MGATIVAMLKIWPVKDIDYWLRQVAGIRAELGRDGVVQYYSEAGERPGIFVGRGAVALGLEGRRVSYAENAEAFRRLMDGQLPGTGEQAVEGPKTGTRVKGWDALFSAPKTISTAWALGDEDLRSRIEAAHTAAASAAFARFDELVAYGRRGRGGLRQIGTEGLIAVAFPHRCSRCSDPHLHTHFLTANMVMGTDGQWGALDARMAHDYALALGYLYQAELRVRLSGPKEMGGIEAGWTEVVNGVAELIGVPAVLAKLFSKRQEEIAEDLAARGIEPTVAARAVAQRRTREAKESGKTTAELVAEWRAEAARAGYDVDPAELERAIEDGGRRVADRHAVMTPDLQRRLAKAITAMTNTFGVRDVVMAVASDFRGGISVADATRLADEFLSSDAVVKLGEAQELRTGDGITLKGGKHIPAPGVDTAVYSTPAVVAAEKRVIEWAVARRSAAVGMARPAALTKALDAMEAGGHPLSAEQVAMVKGIAMDGQGVSVVRAPADSGKTFSLGPAIEAWKGSGYDVIGMAAVTRNAEALGKLGIRTTNLDAVLTLLEGRESSVAEEPDRPWVQLGFRSRTIIIVDEAERMRLDHWTRLAHQIGLSHDCKLVVVGDEKQKGAVGIQGPFRRLSREIGSYELPYRGDRLGNSKNEKWERHALSLLREAGPDNPKAAEVALHEYERHGRVHYPEGKGPRARQTLREQMVADALAARAEARSEGKDILILADRRAERDRLNQIIRSRLIVEGRIDVDHARTYAGLEVAPGDELQTQRQATRHGIANGWVLRVVECQDQGIKAERVDPGRYAGDIVFIPAWYFAQHGSGADRRRGVEYGWVRTVSKEVGASARDAYVFGDLSSIDHASVYTGGSRGRWHWYVAGRPESSEDYDIPAPQEADDQAEPDRAALLLGMIRDRETRPALDVIDELEAANVAAVEALLTTEAERTFARAGVPLDPSATDEPPQVPVKESALETVHPLDRVAGVQGEVVPDPDPAAVAEVASRTRENDQQAAQRPRPGRKHEEVQEEEAKQQRPGQEQQV